VKAPVTIAYPCIGQIPEPDSQSSLLIGDTAVAVTRPAKLKYLAHPTLAELITQLEHLALAPQLGRL